MKVAALRRWTVRSLKVAALTGILAWSAAIGEAQQAAPSIGSPATPKRTYTKNTSFSLPIQMDESVRATLKEVRLYVKTGSSEWSQHEVATPQTPHFTCHAPADGEYCFTLVTVDKSGKPTPSDVRNQPPALRVVVDTRAPVLEASAALEGGETILRIRIADANPDLQSVRATVLTDAGDRSLSPITGQPGAFRLNTTDLQLPIRIAASDMSGNLATRDVVARDLLPASPMTARYESPPLPNTALPTIPTPQASPIIAPPPALPLTAPAPLPSALAANPGTASAPNGLVNAAYRAAPSLDNSEKAISRKIANTNMGTVEYRIETTGPAEVGRIDIYLTPDHGKSWTKVVQDGTATVEAKKTNVERDDIRTPVPPKTCDDDRRTAQLAEQSKEIAELRAQLNARTQERNQLSQDLQQIRRDLQALSRPAEATGGAPVERQNNDAKSAPRRPE